MGKEDLGGNYPRAIILGDNCPRGNFLSGKLFEAKLSRGDYPGCNCPGDNCPVH